MSANALLLSNSKASGPWEEAVSATLGYKYVMVRTHTQTDTHFLASGVNRRPIAIVWVPLAHLPMCGTMPGSS